MKVSIIKDSVLSPFGDKYEYATDTSGRELFKKSTDTSWVYSQKDSVAEKAIRDLRNNLLVKLGNSEQELYSVKKGDNLTKIAKQYAVSIDDILANNPTIENPNTLSIGTRLNLPKSKNKIDYINKKIKGDYAVIPAAVDYRKKTPFELDSINKKLSDEEKIKYVENGNKGVYIIEDKVKHLINVYKNNVLVKQIPSATGKNPGDELTVTKTNDGKLINNAGNMKTPAGMFRISSTAIYHNAPSFQRSKIYENYNIPSSVHTGEVCKNGDSNLSNGCTRVTSEGAKELMKYVKNNSKWYILPEDSTSSNFKITGTGLSFISNDPKKLFSEHARGIRIPKIILPEKNEFLKEAAQVLLNEKTKLSSQLGLSTDTYDKLAVLGLGISGRESGYNNPGITGTVGKIKDWIGNRVGLNMSTGAYQIRPTSLSKELSQKIFNKDSINYKDLENTESSTKALMGVLTDIYKNIAPRYRKSHPNMTLEEITAAYYANPAGFTSKDGQLRTTYAKDVLKNSSTFKLKYS